ncbi:acetyl-CoA carboxylase carboxyltransferase subunit alpha [Candidatus Ornithobacterium hominis]|uniref:acetyl-CoA carboxylase carboxyltransferase subunit alpha n=1 Tax=Candidatus Ornithobacterium hominis TaxID=2497989 RepID=UPI0024BD1400|nr:acetyl-CoA carboxylase carboxyltransferase subunit alpha [Candidatus Ornithobacterium hominis]CAI9429989.1 acetyl-CoA carboxylase carboxyltransferase subunit alpha [Candidatus Ornithobacterium hominis]
MDYLPFEEPIKSLYESYESCRLEGEQKGVDTKAKCIAIEDKILAKKKQIYSKLTPWQRVQLSRHPNRPYALDFIYGLTKNTFIELHGDRNFADDKAMVGGFGKIDEQTFMFIGQQKGKNTKQRQYRRFGMSNPEGYRKAMRLMKLAEKFGKPIVTFIDTPGAYPGLEAEERGQGQAIAQSIYEMMKLSVPVICIVIGEGASGGALGIGIGNRVYMLENTWYSVISPESCSSILWRSWDYKETAAEVLKLTPQDMKKQGIIDGIIPEPLGGAHYDYYETFDNVKKVIKKEFLDLQKLSPEKLAEERQSKFLDFGIFKG